MQNQDLRTVINTVTKDLNFTRQPFSAATAIEKLINKVKKGEIYIEDDLDNIINEHLCENDNWVDNFGKAQITLYQLIAAQAGVSLNKYGRLEA